MKKGGLRVLQLTFYTAFLLLLLLLLLLQLLLVVLLPSVRIRIFFFIFRLMRYTDVCFFSLSGVLFPRE